MRKWHNWGDDKSIDAEWAPQSFDAKSPRCSRATWTQLDAQILVDCSFDNGAGKDRFRFWDSDCAIPTPSDGTIRAEIKIEGVWEKMFFNTSWGKRYHPDEEGAWLKQKVSNNFSAETGRHKYQVRYM